MRIISVSVWKTETEMGTYTVNYNLFMPTVGEQGWGELVNGNFTTIDTTIKRLSDTIGTLEPLSVIQVDENYNVVFPAGVSFADSMASKIVVPVYTNGVLMIYKDSYTTVSRGNSSGGDIGGTVTLYNAPLTRNLVSSPLFEPANVSDCNVKLAISNMLNEKLVSGEISYNNEVLLSLPVNSTSVNTTVHLPRPLNGTFKITFKTSYHSSHGYSPGYSISVDEVTYYV